jgi:hypothetical protein
LVNPEKPTESLAGYGNTAITVYQEKRGEKERDPAGLAAEMGHFLENKALELFIRRFSGYEEGKHFRGNKESWETFYSKNQKDHDMTIEDFQSSPYKHNTQYYTDGMIAHPDCVYVGDPEGKKVTHDGVTVDLSKPFLIEAKSAQKFATKRQDDSFVKGYDFDLCTWQGIPLKHYVQIQYQLALFQVDVAYLALLYDTSNFQVWRVDSNKKWQGKILDTVGRLLKYIEMGKMPREMAMNQADILALYPNMKKDYVMLSGDESEKIKDICEKDDKAKRQIDNWESVRKDCKDALSVYLKDFEEIRSGSDILAKWQSRKGAERIAVSIKDMKKNDPVKYRYMIRNELIKKSPDSRSVAVKWKGE